MSTHDHSSETNTINERQILKQIIEKIIVKPDIINLDYLYELLENNVSALCRQIENLKNNPERLSILFNYSSFSFEYLGWLGNVKRMTMSRTFFFSGRSHKEINTRQDYNKIEIIITNICTLIVAHLYSICTADTQRLIIKTVRLKIALVLFSCFETEIISHCVNKMVVLKIINFNNIRNLNGVAYCLLCKKKYDHSLNLHGQLLKESKIYFCNHFKHSGKVLMCDGDLFNAIRYAWERKSM
jgi:hypothetical protein